MPKKTSALDVVIFCGGRGTRLSEKTRDMPKPLIELGDFPVLWHIFKIYSHYGFNRFLLTLGYKGEMISDYFLNMFPLMQDFSITTSDIRPPRVKEDWELCFIQTGLEARTATRLFRCKPFLHTDQFMVTYGDGVADISIPSLIKRHTYLRKEHGVIGTITITRPYSKYGIVNVAGDVVDKFQEKPQMDNYVNVGFMVMEPGIFDYIDEREDIMFEDTLEEVAKDGKLGYYIHDGFWHAMDTYKDYVDLNEMWRNNPKWKIWNG
jgi:glucose-1-phosphate cytidylyltransferase